MSVQGGSDYSHLPSREMLHQQEEILEGPCMIDNNGDLIKISLEERIKERSKSELGHADRSNEDLLAIHRAWVEKCQQIQNRNQTGPAASVKTRVNISKKISKLLKQSPEYRPIILNMSKKHLIHDAEIANEMPKAETEQIYQELSSFERLHYNLTGAVRGQKNHRKPAQEEENPWLQEGVGLGLPPSPKTTPPIATAIKKAEDHVLEEIALPRIRAGIAHGEAGTAISAEESPQFKPLQPPQLDFLTKLAKTPLLDASKASLAKIKPEKVYELNDRFQFSIYQLNAFAQAVQRRGPSLPSDQVKLDAILADFSKIKQEITAHTALTENEKAAIQSQFEAALQAGSNIQEWVEAFAKYLGSCEALEQSMEVLNAQLSPDGGLKDFSTDELPKAIQALCRADLFGNVSNRILGEEMVKRLQDELTWQGHHWTEDWFPAFQESIVKEQDALRQELQKMKSPLETPVEARHAIEVLCQIELLEKSLKNSKEHFKKGADTVSARMEILKKSSVWGFAPGSKQHHAVLESLIEVEKRLLESAQEQNSIEESFQKQGFSLKNFKEEFFPQLEKMLARALPEAIDQSKKLVEEEGIPDALRENRLSDLKLLYFMLKTIQPKAKELVSLASFINAQTMQKGTSDPLETNPENLRLFLAARRPPKERTLLGKLYHAVFSPEEWSPRTKETVSLLFASMQLLQTATQLASLPKQAEQLKVRAKLMQQELLKKVPFGVQEKITKNADLLGRILGDKFQLFKKEFDRPEFASRPGGEKFDNNLTRGNLVLEEALIAIFKTHSSTPASIATIKDDFTLAQSIGQIEGRGSPFASISLSDWFAAFGTTQGEPEEVESETEPLESAPYSSETTKSEASSVGYLDTIKSMVSGLWSRFTTSTVKEVPHETSPFIQSQQASALNQTKKALETSDALLDRIETLITNRGNRPLVSQTHFEGLKENMIRIQGELASNRTALVNQSNILNLTDCIQSLDDHQHKIQDIEKAVEAAEISGTPSLPIFQRESILNSDQLIGLAMGDVDARRVHAFLADPSTAGILDDSLYAHIIGHASPTLAKTEVRGEKLEGNEEIATMAYQLKVANSILSAIQENPSCGTEQEATCCAMLGLPTDRNIWQHPEGVEQVSKQLKTALYVSEPLFEADTAVEGTLQISDEVPYRKFHTRLTEQVNRLKPGESFFFSGGWMGKEAGHGTAWEVTKQTEGKLTVRHYNTGSGIDYHKHATLELNEKFLHFTEIVDVDPVKLTSNAFSTALWNMRRTSLPEDTTEWGATDIYAGLLRGLNGKFSSRKYSQSDLKLPQFIGICSMEAVMAVVDKTMAEDASAKYFRYLSTLKGTVTYFDKYKESLVSGPGSEERRRLLREGIKALAFRSDAVVEDRTISDEEQAYVKELMGAMSKALKRAEIISAKDISESPLISFTSAPLPIQQMQTPSDFRQVEGAVATQAGQAERVHVPIDTSQFRPIAASNLNTQLDPLLKSIHKGNHETRNYIEVQKTIRNIVLSIPFEDPKFWDAMTSSQAQELLSTLTEINKEYLWSFLHNDERTGCETELPSDDLAAEWMILTLTDKIIHQYPNDMDLQIPDLYQTSFGKLLSQKEMSHVNPDGWMYDSTDLLPMHSSLEWRNKLDEMRSYWDARETEKPFFNFDVYPAGHQGTLKRRIAESEDYRWAKKNLSENEANEMLARSSSWQDNPPRADFELLKNWAEKHPEKVKELDPSLSEKPPQEQAIGLLKQIDKLPQYRDAFTNTYIFDYFLTGSFWGPQRQGAHFDFSKGIGIGISEGGGVRSIYDSNSRVRVDKHISYTEMGYSLFGKEPYISAYEETRGNTQGYTYMNGVEYRVPISPTSIRPGNNLRNTIKEDFDRVLGKIYIGDEVNWRMHLSPAQIVMQQPPKNVRRKDWRSDHEYRNALKRTPYAMSVEHSRNLYSLSSGLQISNTIGFFESDSQRLFKPGYQINFRKLMMEGTKFEEWLRKSPKAAGRVTRLCQKVAKLASESGDINTTTFIAGMSARAAAVYQKEKALHPELFKKISEPEFLDSQKILHDIIHAKDISDEQLALAHRERAVMLGLKDNLSATEAAELLQSVVYTHLFRVPEGYRNDEEVTREVDALIQNRFEKQFIDFLNSPERDAILTSVLKIFLSSPPSGNWSSPKGFPHFQSPDGQISINVLKGTIQALSGTPIPFDLELLGSPNVREVLGQKPPKLQVGITKFVTEMQDPNGHTYRVMDRYKLYRNFNDNWLQFGRSQFASRFLHNQALIAETHLWYQPPAKEKNGELFLTDKETGKVRYKGVLKSTGDQSFTFEKLEKFDESEKAIGQQLLSKDSPALAPFLRMEAPEYVMGWSRNNQLEEVELPRFGLTFKVVEEGGKRKAVCEQLSGFSLVEGGKQHIPELGDVRHYLHLQRVENDGSIKEMVVFPRHFLLGYGMGSLLSTTQPNRNVQIGQVTPQRYFEYSVKGGELVPLTSDAQEAIEANLYMAMVHFSERNTFIGDREGQSKYMAAKKYLDRVDQQMIRSREPLSEPAAELLNAVASLNARVTVDKHPDATALSLKAYYLLLRNQLDFNLGEFPLPLEEVYREYLTHLSLVDKSLLLSSGEELTLLKRLNKLSPIFDYRYKQLTEPVGAEGREDVAQASLKGVKVEAFVPGMPTVVDPKTFIELMLTPPPSGPAKGVLLRNIDASDQFKDYYAIAKGDMDVPDAVAILNKKMGLRLQPNISKEELLHELQMALRLNLATLTGHNKEDVFVTVLLAVATKPEAFMESGEVPRALAEIEKGRKDKKDLTNSIAKAEIELSDAEEEIEKYRPGLEKNQKDLKDLIDKGVPEDNQERINVAQRVNAFSRHIQGLEEQISKLKAELPPLQEQLEKAEESVRNNLLSLKTRLVEPANELITKTALNLFPVIEEESTVSSKLVRERELAAAAQARKVFSISEDFSNLTFEECIELRAAPHETLHTLEKPVIPKEALNQLFKQRPAKPQISESSKPEELFAVKPKDPSLAKAFEEAHNNYVEYVKQGKGIPPEYDLTSPEMVTSLCKTLENDINVLQTTVKAHEDGLLALANKFPDEKGLSSQRSIQIEKGSFKLLTLDEIIRAFYMRDYDYLHKRNPTLKKEEIKQLFSDLKDFLLEATHLNQQKYVLDEAIKLKNGIATGASDLVQQDQIRSFLDAANARRSYNPDDHPEFLVFEYFGKMLIWGVQIDKIKAMSKPDQLGALIELAMGMGKSHVIAPLLAFMNADGEHLAITIMPEPLIDSIAKEMQEKVGLAFNQKVRTMAIKREPVTVERLERMYDNLCEIRDQRQVLKWSPSDTQSLFNQWIEINEAAYEQSQKTPLTKVEMQSLEAKHKSFLKIFKLLATQGKITVDEIHQVFDILKSHSFTFGAAKEVHPDILSAVSNMFFAIVSDDRLTKLHWNFIPGSSGESITPEIYNRSVKGLLIDAMLDRGISQDDPDFQNFFKTLSADDKRLLKEYLMDRPKDETVPSNERNGYQLLKNFTGNGAKRIRNQMATLKETIGTVFPLTEGKKPGVHMGMDESGELTIPFHDGKPTKNSLFANVIERLLYTAQFGLFEGVTEDIIAKEMEAIRKNYDEDIDKGRTPDLTRFREMVGDSDKYSLKRIKPNDYPDIKKNVNKNNKLKMRLVAAHRYPNIKVFDKEIENSAHIIPLLAPKEQGVTGMSGTLSNVPTLPKIFQLPQLSDTQSKTLDILRRNSPKTVATLPLETAKQPDAIFGEGKKGSIIDSAGHFSSEDSEEMARAMLKSLAAENFDPPIEGVVYDDDNVFKVVTLRDKHPILYNKSMDKNKLAALWNLSQITGSDIPLGPTMHARMIVGKDVTIVTLMQAAWRLRGLAKGQTVSFTVPPEDKAYIIKMLKEHLGMEIDESRDLTDEELYSYALLNQVLIESGNNFRAIKERMKIAFMSRILAVMWADGTSFEKAFKIYEQTRSLFIKELPSEPWELWGAPTQMKLTEAVLKELLSSWKENAVVKKIQENPDIYPGFDLEGLFAEWERIVTGDNGPLPQKVSTAASYGMTVEKQTQQQTQQQMQQQTQTQTQTHVQLEFESGKTHHRNYILPVYPFEEKELTPLPLTDVSSLNYESLNKEFFKSKNASACITANDMIRSNKKLEDFAGMFDEDLLVTLNLAPVYQPTSDQPDYEAFGKLQFACTSVELIMDEESNKLKVKMLDNGDAAMVSRAIEVEHDRAATKEGSQAKIRIALYQLQNDKMEFEQEGTKEIPLDQQEIRKRALELTVQAKFAAGFLEYPQEEIPYLRNWIEKVGPKKALDLMGHILNPIGRSDSRRRFSGSGLARIFKEFGLKAELI